jgi:hypothetical protein
LVLSPTGSINLGFITEGRLAVVLIIPSLGVPNWSVIYINTAPSPAWIHHKHLASRRPTASSLWTDETEGGREMSTHRFGYLRKGVDVRGALCENEMGKAGVLLQNV